MDVNLDPIKSRKRIRALKSCLSCRQRKRKCGQEKPSCGYCTGKNLPCQYQETDWNIKVSDNRGGGIKDVDESTITSEILSISARVMQLEAALKHKGIEKQPQTQSKLGRINLSRLAVKHEREQIHNGLTENAAGSRTITNGALLTNKFPTQDSPSVTDVIDFHSDNFPNKFSLIPNHGILSWVSLLRKDIYLSSFSVSLKNEKIKLFQREKEAYCRQLSMSSKKNSILVKALPNNTELPHSDPQLFIQQSQNLSSETGKDFIDKYEDETVEFNPHVLQKQRKEQTLLEMLSNLLKNKKLVWLLINRFFDSELYYVLPILDREEFTKDLIQIIGPGDTELDSDSEFNIKRRSELAVIGTLIIIMRLSSCSFYNCGKPNFSLNDDERYILDHPIGLGAMKVVNKCIIAIQNYKISEIKILQMFLMKKCYSFYSPEDSDCTTFADPASLGLLLDYSFRCGINRDPSLSKDKSAPPNLIRRLWHKVLYLDQHQLMLVGCPSLIDSRYHDTHFPYLDESENAFELCINKSILERADLFNKCYPLLMMILDVKNSPKISEVKKRLSELKTIIEEQGTFEEIRQLDASQIENSVTKLNRFHTKIDHSSLLFVIFYHFFIFYNRNNDKQNSVHYLLELIKLVKTFIELSLYLDPKFPEFNLAKDFNIPMLLIPRIELSLHRSLQLLFSICGRANALIILSTNLERSISEVARTVCNLCTQISKRVVSRIQNIGDAYYHCWVGSKVQAFITKNLMEFGYRSDSPVYQTFVTQLSTLKESDRIIFDYTLEDFQSIVELLQELDGISFSQNTHVTKSSPTKKVITPCDLDTDSNENSSSVPNTILGPNSIAREKFSNDPLTIKTPHNPSITTNCTVTSYGNQYPNEDTVLSEVDRIWLEQMLHGNSLSGVSSDTHSSDHGKFGNSYFDFLNNPPLNFNNNPSHTDMDNRFQPINHDSLQQTQIDEFMQMDDAGLNIFGSFF